MSNPSLIIDMHTHMFNANYVPLEQIFISRGVPSYLADKLAKLIQILTRSSKLKMKLPQERAVEISLETLFQSNQLVNAQIESQTPGNNSIYETFEDLAITQLYLEVEGAEDRFSAILAVEESEIYNFFTDINSEFGDGDSTGELDLDSPDGLIDSIHKNAPYEGVTNKGLFGALRKMLRRFLTKIASFVEHAGDLLDFSLTMLREEKHLLRRLEGYYSEKDLNFLLVHYMMDMAYPFKGKVKFGFYKKQLPKMTRLEKYSQGALIGFSAFDPIRCLTNNMSDGDIHKLLDQALSKGKIGFKFYPPMGFRAADNINQPGLEHVVDVFFDYCAAHGIPVFTHCTPEGFEQSPGKTGPNSNPKYWRSCLEKPGRENLILCFGHAGGGLRKVGGRTVYGWLAGANDQDKWEDPDNYARDVADICRTYKNVYCEIAYMHEIIGDDCNTAKFQERLAIELGDAANAGHDYHLSDKMMYGSDWHMPSMINDIGKYLDGILEMFSDSDLSSHQDKFFYANALKYLDLESQFDRLAASHGDQYIDGLKQRLQTT